MGAPRRDVATSPSDLIDDLASCVGAANVRTAPLETALMTGPLGVAEWLERRAGGRKPAPLQVAVRVTSAEQATAVLAAAGRRSASVRIAGLPGHGALGIGPNPVVVLDLSALAAISVVDRDARTCDVGAGVPLVTLEANLRRCGLTLACEPAETSSARLGAVLSRRRGRGRAQAACQLDDRVICADVMWADGRIETVGRHHEGGAAATIGEALLGASAGRALVLGARLLVEPAPMSRWAAAFSFSSFELGIEALRVIAMEGHAPTSMALLDRGGQALSTHMDRILEIGCHRDTWHERQLVAAYRFGLRHPHLLRWALDRSRVGGTLVVVHEGSEGMVAIETAGLRDRLTRLGGVETDAAEALAWQRRGRDSGFLRTALQANSGYADVVKFRLRWSAVGTRWRELSDQLGSEALVAAELVDAGHDGVTLCLTALRQDTDPARLLASHQRLWALVAIAEGTKGVAGRRAAGIPRTSAAVAVETAIDESFDPAGRFGQGRAAPAGGEGQDGQQGRRRGRDSGGVSALVAHLGSTVVRGKSSDRRYAPRTEAEVCEALAAANKHGVTVVACGAGASRPNTSGAPLGGQLALDLAEHLRGVVPGPREDGLLRVLVGTRLHEVVAAARAIGRQIDGYESWLGELTVADMVADSQAWRDAMVRLPTGAGVQSFRSAFVGARFAISDGAGIHEIVAPNGAARRGLALSVSSGQPLAWVPLEVTLRTAPPQRGGVAFATDGPPAELYRRALALLRLSRRLSRMAIVRVDRGDATLAVAIDGERAADRRAHDHLRAVLPDARRIERNDRLVSGPLPVEGTLHFRPWSTPLPEDTTAAIRLDVDGVWETRRLATVQAGGAADPRPFDRLAAVSQRLHDRLAPDSRVYWFEAPSASSPGRT